MDLALIEAHGKVPALMPSLHLPVQSGSNRILGKMNRGYSVDDYRRLVDRLRTSCPDIALSSDFIVGFPGETEVEFEATMTLVKQIGFAQAYSFKYSSRPGTPAALLGNHVDEAVKGERLLTLQALLSDQQHKFNDSMIGRRLEVLLEKPGRYPRQLVGRSPYLQPVHVVSKDDAVPPRIGELIKVEITGSCPNSLAGVLDTNVDGDGIGMENFV
jgi:tRNA-2-methylthio-N6-dimethylallyladenosine synthase